MSKYNILYFTKISYTGASYQRNLKAMDANLMSVYMDWIRNLRSKMILYKLKKLIKT